ncbi:TPA: hypothetical protein HA246_00090 [Candidatus Woesearchaeota archaeon]|nr:hypothetical protein [Candidatus Woesearchaeota archaeon]
MLIKKRGQAAMEFLMTYGWAILVVLVVIGALAYFGVLNPQSFLPKKCQFSTGLVCSDHVLRSSGELVLRINNGLGNDITINNITFESDNSIIACKTDTSDESKTVPAGSEANFKLSTPTDAAKTTTCGTGGADAIGKFKGSRVKGKLNLAYTDLQTQFPHQQQGTLLTDVE